MPIERIRTQTSNFSAVVVGSHVPSKLTGSIFSVHDHVINIRDDGGYRLVSIVDRATDLTALAVLVSRLPRGAQPGQTVRCADGSMTVGDVASGFTIDLGTASRRFEGSIAGPSSGAGRRALCTLLPELRAAVLSYGAPGGLRDLLRQEYSRESKPKSASAALVARAAEILENSGDISGLVGLGPGFTPSGDDFIAGYLAAFAAAESRPRSERDGVTSPVRAGPDPGGVRSRLGATTIGGATLLEQALVGSFPAYLCDFAARIAAACSEVPGEPGGVIPSRSSEVSSSGVRLRPALADAVARAAIHGETSGTDALTGFVLALDRICESQQLDEFGD